MNWKIFECKCSPVETEKDLAFLDSIKIGEFPMCILRVTAQLHVIISLSH